MSRTRGPRYLQQPGLREKDCICRQREDGTAEQLQDDGWLSLITTGKAAADACRRRASLDEEHHTELLEDTVGRGGERAPEPIVDSAFRGACRGPLVDVLDSKKVLPIRLAGMAAFGGKAFG